MHRGLSTERVATVRAVFYFATFWGGRGGLRCPPLSDGPYPVRNRQSRCTAGSSTEQFALLQEPGHGMYRPPTASFAPVIPPQNQCSEK